jgi:hypothetical protein
VNGPDSLHGDPVLDAMAEREQKAAVQATLRVARTLRALGFDFVLVRVSKVLSHDGMCVAPGATAFDSSERIVPCLPREADALRSIADELDAEFARSGATEATEGWSEDITRRQTDFEGPKQ